MPNKHSPHGLQAGTPPGYPGFPSTGSSVPPYSHNPASNIATSQTHMSAQTGQSHNGELSAAEGLLPKDLAHVSDQELTALLSRQDIATSLAEDLLAQFSQQGATQDNKDSLTQSGDSSSHKSSNQNLDTLGGIGSDPFGSSDKPYSPASSGLPGQLLNEGSTSPRSITHSAPPNEVCGTMTTDVKGDIKPQKPKLSKGSWDEEDLKPDPVLGMQKSGSTTHLSPSSVCINMKASEIIASCRGAGTITFHFQHLIIDQFSTVEDYAL